MSREFKFRAFHVPTNQYIHCVECGIETSNTESELPFYKAIAHDDYIVEQSTGLEDEKGFTIYEGDVLRSTNILNAPIYKVVFKDACFMAQYTAAVTNCTCTNCKQETTSIVTKYEPLCRVYFNTEIIGNVHSGVSYE